MACSRSTGVQPLHVLAQTGSVRLVPWQIMGRWSRPLVFEIQRLVPGEERRTFGDEIVEPFHQSAQVAAEPAIESDALATATA